MFTAKDIYVMAAALIDDRENDEPFEAQKALDVIFGGP